MIYLRFQGAKLRFGWESENEIASGQCFCGEGFEGIFDAFGRETRFPIALQYAYHGEGNEANKEVGIDVVFVAQKDGATRKVGLPHLDRRSHSPGLPPHESEDLAAIVFPAQLTLHLFKHQTHFLCSHQRPKLAKRCIIRCLFRQTKITKPFARDVLRRGPSRWRRQG